MQSLLTAYRDCIDDPLIRIFLWSYFHVGISYTLMQYKGYSISRIPIFCCPDMAGLKALLAPFHPAHYQVPELSLSAGQFRDVHFCGKDEVLLLQDRASELGGTATNLQFLERLMLGETYERPCRMDSRQTVCPIALQAAPLLCSARGLYLTSPNLFFVLAADRLGAKPIPPLDVQTYAHSFNRFLANNPELLSQVCVLPEWLASANLSADAIQFCRTLYGAYALSGTYARLGNIPHRRLFWWSTNHQSCVSSMWHALRSV